jgi:hypothetical protein
MCVTSPSQTGVLSWMRLGRRGGGDGVEARWEGEGPATGFKAQDRSRKSTEEEVAGGTRAASQCAQTNAGATFVMFQLALTWTNQSPENTRSIASGELLGVIEQDVLHGGRKDYDPVRFYLGAWLPFSTSRCPS